jgi:hypothetical protein
VDLRKGTRIRIAKEHVLPAVGSVGGEHKSGSAMIYSDDAEPTTRPDGTTTLTTTDIGRVWYNTDTHELKTLISDGSTGTVWTTPLTPCPSVLLADQGTAGATGTARTWNDRRVGVYSSYYETDADFVTVPSSGPYTTFTLPAGAYTIFVRAFQQKTDRCQLRLWSVTDGAAFAYGESGFALSTSTTVIWITLQARFVITVSTQFKIQNYVQTGAIHSFGIPMDEDTYYTGDGDTFLTALITQEKAG